MKFTKEDAIKELVAQMTARGEKLNLSQRSINEQMETLFVLVANEEMEIGDFIAKILPVFKTADANVRNDVSVGINEYKEKNPIPKKDPDEDKKKAVDSAIEERLAALEQRNRELELENKMKGIKNQLRSYLLQKGVTSEEWIDIMLNEVSIKDDVNIEERGNSLLEMYNKMYGEIKPSRTPKRREEVVDEEKLNESIKAAAEYAKSQRLI